MKSEGGSGLDLGGYPGRGRDHRTLAEKAFVSIHGAILTGNLKPGERIPIEELASRLDMSPMPVREAVRRLDGLGLVENIPHKGARVTELSVADLHQIYEARLALEPLAVYRAAQAFTPQDERAARAQLASMRRHRTSAVDAWPAHSAFHLCLYRASGSDWLIRLIQPLWESSERYRLALSPASSNVARPKEHENVLRACIDHDPGRAAFELYNHLVATASTLAKTLGSSELFVPLQGGRWDPPMAITSQR